MAIYSKIIPSVLLISSFFVLMPVLNAQENETYWHVDYAKGSIIKHRKIVNSLFQDYPSFFSIGWHNTANPDSEWKERFNYLDWGFVLFHQQFNNEILGNTTSLNYTTTYYLRDRNSRNKLNIQLGFGFGYNSDPFDFETNLSNIVMTSHFLFSQHFKLNYFLPDLFNKIGLQTGITFTHYSNGSLKKPNLGVNSLFVNLGLNYSKNKTTYKRLTEKEKLPKQPYDVSVSLNAGFHESNPGLGVNSVYFATAYLHKKLGHKSALQVGVDFFNSQSVKDYANLRYISMGNSDNELKDHKQIGGFFGHELFFNKLSLETQVGYYLYKPFKEGALIYQKISFKHSLNKKRSALSINLKIHYFEAEYISLGLHHQIF